MLNRMKDGKDMAHKVRKSHVALDKELSREQLTQVWSNNPGLPALNRVMNSGDRKYQIMLKGGIGVYDVPTGEVQYEVSNKRALVYWINRLHYNRVRGWSFMADFFAVSLIFFALSGLLMVKGKNSVLKRGKWYLLIGLLIPVVYILLS
jgi:hypothetical protein